MARFSKRRCISSRGALTGGLWRVLKLLLNLFDERERDCLKVLVPNGVVLALMHLVDLKTIAEIVLIFLSIGYTAWRWNRDARKEHR